MYFSIRKNANVKTSFAIVFTIFAAALLLFCPGEKLFAQSNVGTIVGTATAPDGAAIQGASVTVTNESTTAVRSAATDQQGNYAVPDLNPGAYTVVVSSPGFATLHDSGVVLASQQTIRIDAPLKIGNVSSQVVVTVGQPVLDSQMASISTTLTPTDITKSSTNLIGTVDTTGDSGLEYFQDTLPASNGPDFNWSTYGSRQNENYLNVDGVSSTSVIFGQAAAGPGLPSVDIVQELKYDVVNNKAEFASVMTGTAITKSGSNRFHGDLFDHNSNDGIAAQNYFSTRKGSYNLNNFGASLSGPIWKNKLFFFGAFEGVLESLPTTINANVPTNDMRAGNFSALLPGIVIKNPYTGQPFQNNTIPPNLLATAPSQTAQKWQTMFYPTPNFGPPNSFVGNYRATLPGTVYNNRYDLRIDANTSAKNTLFVRFSYDRASPETPGPLPYAGVNVQRRWTYSGVVSDTWIVTPNLFNIVKVGAFHEENEAEAKGPFFGQSILDALGIQGFPVSPPTAPGTPTVPITGFTTPTIGTAPQDTTDEVNHIIDQVTYQRGNHTIKTGFEFRPQEGTSRYYANFGVFTFNGSQSGFSYADFMLGLPQATSYTYVRPTEYARLFFLGAFAQDDWRITPNLVLSYGIRYDYDKPAVDKYDTVSSFDPATGAIVVPSLAVAQKYMNPEFPPQIPIISSEQASFPRRSLRNGFFYGISPRIGFAYSINPNTVIKGGYGVFSDPVGGQTFSLLYQAPYGGTIGYTNSYSNGLGTPCSPAAPCNPSITFNRPVNSAGKLGAVVLNSLDVNLRNPILQQTSLTLERNIGFSTSLRFSYVGTFDSDLTYGRNINQVPVSTTPFAQANTPYPLYQTINEYANGGRQNYNSFTVEANHNMRNGLLFEAALTYAKNLTDDPGERTHETGIVAEDTYNLRRQWGNDQFTPRLDFVSKAIWMVPVGPGGWVLRENSLWSKILGGWQLSLGYLQQTGQYLTPTFSGADPSNTNQFSGTADRTGHPAPIGKRTINNWYNPKAYAIPKNGTFGNAGFGSIESPGYWVLNSAVYKTFPTPKSTSIEVAASFTNVLNHPNFGTPDVNVTDAGAGKITTTSTSDFAGPRAGLLSARFNF